ncbi:MAG: SUMF1/EgtB/PvdO family nonheme iron enzyme [Alphaproteobacteria bacterium]|nr:SUMF1/EgtB/PvdO family nonheme iron enzyme [Alphaproteobacteria bacterium]MCB9792132.1 SUMF1/EgtB/PvdO family nonheme iron enzyme [Alphaproteobacteria bacterium]
MLPFLTSFSLESLDTDEEPIVPEGMAFVDVDEVIVRNRLYTIRPFAMDVTPVTNAQWKTFVDATGEVPPPYWLGDHPAAHLHDHPVVGITLEQARRYAAWRGGRLPTTLEWIAAAKGEWSAQAFPWGDSCDRRACHCPLDRPRETAPVGTHPAGASPDGVLDLYGNTWEWTEPDRCEEGLGREQTWVMGGSYDTPCEARTRTPMRAHFVDQDALNVGLRCVVDLY